MFSWDNWSVQTGPEQVVKIFGGKAGCLIVVRSAWRKFLMRQHANAIDQLLLIACQFQLRVNAILGRGSDHCVRG